MAAIKFPLRTPAAVTAPTNVMPVTIPAAESVKFFDGLPLSIVEVPSLRGLAVANGVDPVRLVVADEVYDAGLLAPKAGPTLATSGARATAEHDMGAANPSNNDAFLVGKGGGTTVKYASTLDLTGASGHQVLIGADVDTTLANEKALINDEAGYGTKYVNAIRALALSPVWQFYSPLYMDVECPNAVDTVNHRLLYRAVSYGSAGNAYHAAITVDTANGQTTGLGAGFFDTAGVFSGGSNPTAGDPTAGVRDYAYQSARSVDNALSGRSPTTTFESTSDGNVAVSGMTANADATSDRTRLIRTAAGGTELLRVGEISSGGSTTTDKLSDEQLLDFGIPAYDPLAFRTYKEGFPPKVRHLALWKGRLAGIGAVLAADYTSGTAAATKTTTGLDNDTVTLTGATLDPNMVGRQYSDSNANGTYTILKVNVASSTLTLDRGYEGLVTDAVSTAYASLTYTIRDARDGSQLYLSEPNKPNQWPTRNNPGGVESDDTEGGTGLFATDDYLFAFSRTSIAALSGDDPENWQMHTIVTDVGCLSGQTLVGTPAGMAWLGRGAIYLWNGSGKPVPISTASVGRNGRPRGIDRTFDRISMSHVHQAWATPYDEATKTVLFFVPMDGSDVPNYCIVLDLANMGVWGLDQFSEMTAGGLCVAPDGTPAMLMGDSLGCLWHTGLDTTTDGAHGFVAVQTLSGAQTVRTLTTGGTALPTSGDGLAGAPVVVAYAGGTTAYRKVASNTSAAVVLSRDLDTAPAASDQIDVGCIDCDVETGRFAASDEWGNSGLRDVVTLHSPEAASSATDTTKEYHFAYGAGQATEAILTRGFDRGDTTASSGRRRFRTQSRAPLHKLRWRCLDPESAFILRGFILLADAAAPDPE